jgi:hypothetical protein
MNPAVTTPVPATAALAKYAGDIIGKTASTTETMLYVIIGATFQPTSIPAVIYKSPEWVRGIF